MNRKKGTYNLEKYRAEEEANFLKRRKIKRRAGEVIHCLNRFLPGLSGRTVLDIGTSDGKLLEALRQRFPDNLYFGLDSGLDPVRLAREQGRKVLCADGGRLPVSSGSIHLVVSTATLEHVERPGSMLEEIKRVLVPGGTAILTTPHAFWIRCAELAGIEPRNEHYRTFRLKQLKRFFIQYGFQVLDCYKFMFFPFTFTAERDFEAALARMGLDFLMVNQMIVARK